MKELEMLEVKIKPGYSYGEPMLSIRIRYKGEECVHEEVMRHPDTLSVLDYCFERARQQIKDIIEAAERRKESEQSRG